MGAISRINKSSLNQRTKTQLRKALLENSTIKYLAADFAPAQSSVVQLPVTGLSIPVYAGKVYKFDAFIRFTAATASDGFACSFTGSATADFISGVFNLDGGIAATTTISTIITAITTTSSATEGVVAAGVVTATGVYRPSVDGYFKVASAQVVSGATASAVKKGSYLQLTEVNN